ncbi:MAG: hypothetical protein KC877_04150 [Candidatus Kaiserbacteria bacterium]|nr:hypothetical protein [Candidatus Kaiserbacteria bacterium]MCB9816753.1 hypothetical protein [Candidatus Nomurabacteria bacterium]
MPKKTPARILHVGQQWLAVSETLYENLIRLADEAKQNVEEYAAAIIAGDKVRLADVGQNDSSEAALAVMKLYEFCLEDCRASSRATKNLHNN